MLFRTLLALFALAVGVAGPASAQVATTGTVVVTIQDPDGGRLPGVVVTARAADTVTTRSTVTNEEGVATLEALAPSALYQISAQLSGFQDQIRPNILVRSGQTTSVPLTLALGNVTEAVTVTAASPIVDTRSATSGQDITLQLTESLPTGRSYPAPRATTSPSWCARLTSTPLVVAGTSTVTLSVSSSTMVSPAVTASPSRLSQREIVASTMDSPSGGTLIGIIPGDSLRGVARRSDGTAGAGE
jgi:hypothetical protein